MSKTAIVILNWNGKEMLQKFLGNVYHNSNPDYNDIYVVDNGSTDDSLNWVISNLPGVKTIQFDDNLGFAGGYSRALGKIKAEYFVLLNSDIEVTPGWLNPVITYMENNLEVAACQPKILDYNKKENFEYAGAAGGFIDSLGFPFCRGRIHNVVEADIGQYDDIKEIFWASGACLFIRSSVWEQSGGLDTDFFLHMEEIDLCWRIHKLGHKIVYIPDSVVYHVGGGTLPYQSPAKVFYNFRNNLFMLHKNLPGKNFRNIIFKRMLIDGLGALRFLLMLDFRSFLEVFKAHFSYYQNKKILDSKRNKILSGPNLHPERLILNKSMVLAFFLRGEKTFGQLWSDN